MDYGVFLMDHVKNYKEANELLFQSLENFLIRYGQIHNITAICYQNIGELYYYLNEVDSALIYFQRSLLSAIPEFLSLDLHVNPEISVENQKTRILNTLKWKAKSFSLKFET